MYFCPIAPEPFLRELSSSRDHHFALAQWLKADNDYREHYTYRAGRGDIVIVDNGAYEGEMLSFRELLDMEGMFENKAIFVAPDVIGQPALSAYLTEAYIDYRGHTQRLMTVVHANDTWEFIRYYHRVRTEWVGIPKSLVERSELCIEMAKSSLWNPNRRHHLLGLHDTEMNAMALQPLAWLFESCDDKGPYKKAGDSKWQFNQNVIAMDKACRNSK